MAVEHESGLQARDAALVPHGLAVILAGALESIELEETIGCGVETRWRDLASYLVVADPERA